jgi:hypothetical protein
MRTLAMAAAAAGVAAIAGCGGSAPTPAPTPAPKGTPSPRERTYTPSAHHSHRPPHSIYGDEVGENIVGLATPYRRVLALFGPPLDIRPNSSGRCVYYRIVNQLGGWEFCFKHGRMDSAQAQPPHEFAAR